MSELSPVYSLATARAAEQFLLQRQQEPDELMKKAAAACAEVAAAMLPESGRVLIVAGRGGNGGDGLFAGAHLALAGHPVHAVLSAGTAHQAALDTFQAAGGEVVREISGTYDVVIDAVAGLGSTRAASAELAALMARGSRVLAIDSPTGCGTEGSITADATVTFGHARSPHARFAECGEVIIADIGLREVFEQHEPESFTSFEPSLDTSIAASKWAGVWAAELPSSVRRLADTGPIPNLIPGIADNKYTHGVTGIAAGSSQFPGAGIMCTAGALHTTTSMVVAVGDSSPSGSSSAVVSRFPEVVPTRDVRSAHRVDAWVVGPGRGTDDAALKELEEILDTQLPVVVDADGITLIAQHAHLREKLRQRIAADAPAAVLTPHAGEFARLSAAAGTELSQQELSEQLGCHILLKGRITAITSPGIKPVSVNTGNSFAATAGSGDVLAGILGALLALPEDNTTNTESTVQRRLLSAVAIHAHAAALAAKQPEGYAPTTAMGIAQAVGRSIAKLSARRP